MAAALCLAGYGALPGLGPALGAQELAAPAASTADFSGGEFGDFTHLARFLAKQGPNFPVSRRLRPAIQEYLKAGQGQGLPEPMRRQITDDLNAMLADRSLFREIKDWYGHNDFIENGMLETFFPADGRLLRWLARVLETEGLFDAQPAGSSALAAGRLRSLNRLLLLGMSHEHPTQYSEEPPPPLWFVASATAVISTPLRRAMLRPERVAAYLGVRPGMVIADIGAGCGAYALPLADAARDAGRIYATEISSADVSCLKIKAASAGHKNLVAVPVKREGVDPFYQRHVFDLILVADTYPELINPVAYFDGLRPSLKPGIGRLCIIQQKADPDFTELEFGDFKDVLKTLKAEGPRFPVCKRLRPKIQEYLQSWRGQEVPRKPRQAITADLNALLSEKSLLQELEDFHGDGSMIIKDHLAQWLAARLRDEGIFARESRPIPPLARQELRALNRILLTGIFPTRVWRDTLLPDLVFMRDRETIVKKLASAGYALTRDNEKLLPYFHILEFKRAR